MTAHFGLIGQPVAGSKSPWVHEQVFKQAGIEADYCCFNVEATSLESAVKGLVALGFKGFNVTVPYKEAILPLLDEVSPQAKVLGAVNTVNICDGRLVGYNTDGLGLEAVLSRHLGALAPLRVLVLGAGGAASGICGALLLAGVKSLAIHNRSTERAKALIARLGDLSDALIDLVEEDFTQGHYDLIINTTSVGMAPDDDKRPIDLDLFDYPLTVCDIVYKPHETQLIQQAKGKGFKVIYGIEMLIEQALLAEAIWNEVPQQQLDAARQDLLSQLETA